MIISCTIFGTQAVKRCFSIVYHSVKIATSAGVSRERQCADTIGTVLVTWLAMYNAKTIKIKLFFK